MSLEEQVVALRKDTARLADVMEKMNLRAERAEGSRGTVVANDRGLENHSRDDKPRNDKAREEPRTRTRRDDRTERGPEDKASGSPPAGEQSGSRRKRGEAKPTDDPNGLASVRDAVSRFQEVNDRDEADRRKEFLGRALGSLGKKSLVELSDADRALLLRWMSAFEANDGNVYHLDMSPSGDLVRRKQFRFDALQYLQRGREEDFSVSEREAFSRWMKYDEAGDFVDFDKD